MSEPTVFVVDDDTAVRESLQWLIGSVGLAVQTYASAQDFLDHYDPGTPGCLLLDVRLPGMSGLDLQDSLLMRQLTIPVIMMTGYGEIASAVRAMKQGALDYILKPFQDQLLLDRIHEAIELDTRNRERESRRADLLARFKRLTPREREVMGHVVAGQANKMIAAEMHLSIKTVEAHRASTMRKMEADSLADLVRMSRTVSGVGEDPSG